MGKRSIGKNTQFSKERAFLTAIHNNINKGVVALFDFGRFLLM